MNRSAIYGLALTGLLVTSPLALAEDDGNNFAEGGHDMKDGAEKLWDGTKDGAEEGWDKTKDGAEKAGTKPRTAPKRFWMRPKTGPRKAGTGSRAARKRATTTPIEPNAFRDSRAADPVRVGRLGSRGGTSVGTLFSRKIDFS